MNQQEKNNYDRIVDIIAYVISELRQNKTINEVDISELQDRGYTNSEISTAFSWLADRLEFSEQVFIESDVEHSSSFRVLHEAERELFTREAWGNLVEYMSLGIISNEHVESILEKSLMSGAQRIDDELLKTFIATSIFNASADIPGNRIMLNGNDTIN